MPTLVDSSIWIDYFRRKTPRAIKQQAAEFVLSAEAVLCEPVRFEVLRALPSSDRGAVTRYFARMPILPTPKRLWEDATDLGTKCADDGMSPAAFDLLIAQTAIEYDAELVTFDVDFLLIAKVSNLKLRLLKR